MQIKGETYGWCAIDELSNWNYDKPFRGGDALVCDMFSSAKGMKQMNPANEKPLYGGDKGYDPFAPGPPTRKMAPEQAISALERMGYGARAAWWRRNRPSLEQLAKSPAGLSASQQKTLDKKARKRAANLARLGKR